MDLWETVPTYARGSDRRNLAAFQDYMIRYLMSRAGELKVHAQFHTGCGGPGPHPDLLNANPALLYDFLTDEQIKGTNVVLLHTGYPYVEETALMAAQFVNVYVDISIGLLFHGAYERSLRTILEFAPPQKVIFGTDAVEFAELFGYHSWFIKETLRRLLEEFTQTHGWSSDKCMEVAGMILNKNAKALGARKTAG